MLNDEGAWQNERSHFGIAKFAEQSENISINRFGPNLLARIEIAADQRHVDLRTHRSRIERDQPAFGVTAHSNLHVWAMLLTEPLHRCQHSLHFVTDDMTAHVERLTINPFAMRLIGV